MSGVYVALGNGWDISSIEGAVEPYRQLVVRAHTHAIELPTPGDVVLLHDLRNFRSFRMIITSFEVTPAGQYVTLVSTGEPTSWPPPRTTLRYPGADVGHPVWVPLQPKPA